MQGRPAQHAPSRAAIGFQRMTARYLITLVMTGDSQVTAEEVASLKKVGKGSTLLLLDNNNGRAKDVAKRLASKGFRRAFTVANGFKGAPSPMHRSAATESRQQRRLAPHTAARWPCQEWSEPPRMLRQQVCCALKTSPFCQCRLDS